MMGMDELGRELHKVRQMKRQSLHAVASEADISPTYLQKLEQGLVKLPSPPVLQRLARALDLPYTALMEKAGYLERPRANTETAHDNLLAHALMSEQLTDEEAAALADYLAFIRQRRNAAS